MAKRDYAKGSIPYGFVSLPKDIIQSSEWQTLPPSAIKLAIDLMSQYTGKNNGRLCPSITVMKQCGWKSSKTLLDAKSALLECLFVVMTRKGHPPSTAEWVGFTWWRLDYDREMDIDPAKFPYLNFINLIQATNKSAPIKLTSVVQNLKRLAPKQASACSVSEAMS
ncbi:hypothetical protein [Glaciimonas sp. PAMC28666]|uniref:hypothetical protein n=1 Tax=Glaciimonas sp. PAMC28666 TaxID=2807626 RepID=UPI0019632A28|nr:hypothetical protein [Glaciimonas sp. PAMC28666]QRX83271.1 hypothetical protein JQN73_03050 [Glaciimonas sp. PAMC28666]